VNAILILRATVLARKYYHSDISESRQNHVFQELTPNSTCTDNQQFTAGYFGGKIRQKNRILCHFRRRNSRKVLQFLTLLLKDRRF
jgi:hypothetical protein